MPGHMGMTFTEVGDDYLIAKLPVDHRNKQPLGLLHGGASAAVAETIGSVASFLLVDHDNGQGAAGVELNISHLRSVSVGHVYARCSPIRIGRKLHVWNIVFTDDQKRDIAIARLTTMVVGAS